jgi:hypothetical protein
MRCGIWLTHWGESPMSTFTRWCRCPHSGGYWWSHDHHLGICYEEVTLA